MEDCVFCKIVAGDAPAHKIWEDEDHIAFLSIFPNTEGFSVVATKKHLPSYVLDLNDEDYNKLLLAVKKVGKLLDSAFDDVGRTGAMLEGFGVDHAHVKLFPMHGTKSPDWQQRQSSIDKYFDNYEGYLSSHNGPRAADEKLAELAKRIRSKGRRT